MERFHGVATHYLKNYLGWRMMLERYERGVNIKACLHEALGHWGTGATRNRNIANGKS